MPILGLTSTESWDSYRDKNVRRSVQYQYPNGKAPLLGLLSIMDTEEDTNDPYYSHWEYRDATPRTTTLSQGSSKGPFLDSGGSDAGDPVSFVAGTTYKVQCASGGVDNFLAGNVIKITVDTTTATNKFLVGWVTAVDTSTDIITFKCVEALDNVKNGATDENVGKEVLFIGKSFTEGRSSVEGQVITLPSEFYNYTQIHRTPITFTGRELKVPVKFDESGIYKHRVKQISLDHMRGIELAMLFGKRYKDYSAANVVTSTGAGLPATFSGGIMFYLEQWEASAYKTVTATADTDDDKRIIENTAGTMDEDTFDGYMERLFRYTSNSTNEKLCFCGTSALRVINQMFKHKSVLNTNIPSRDAYGMRVVELLTPFGSVFFKTHPLFNENPTMRYWMLFLDVKNMKYRAMKDRDTQLLKNRHDRDFDGRRDEWFSDCGMEMWFPENNMLIKNVQSYTP